MKKKQLIIVGIVALIGVAIYFLTKKNTTDSGVLSVDGTIPAGSPLAEEYSLKMLALIPASDQNWVMSIANEKWKTMGDKALALASAIATSNPNSLGSYSYTYGSVTGKMLWDEASMAELWRLQEEYKLKKSGW